MAGQAEVIIACIMVIEDFWRRLGWDYRNHSGYGLSQWETTLHCNVISHWLSSYPQWSLHWVCAKGMCCVLWLRKTCTVLHEDIVTWNHFPHYWPFVWGINWSLLEPPYKGTVMWSFGVFFVVRLRYRDGVTNALFISPLAKFLVCKSNY